MAEKLSGIIDPPIDELLSKVDSKYQLVIFASKRARQINDYYADLHEGSLFDNLPPPPHSPAQPPAPPAARPGASLSTPAAPPADWTTDKKPLSVALHEINEDKLVLAPL